MSLILGWDIVGSTDWVKQNPTSFAPIIEDLAINIRFRLEKLEASTLQFRGDGELFMLPGEGKARMSEYLESIQLALKGSDIKNITVAVADGKIINSSFVGPLSEAFWRIDSAIKNPDNILKLDVELWRIAKNSIDKYN